MLYQYMKDCQRFLRDGGQNLIDPADLIEFINRARRVIAEQTQCIRILAPTSGSLNQITLINGGSGYTNPVVTITPPDYPSGEGQFPLGAQATATATLIDGVINDIQVNYGGYGYFQPQVIITDPTGSGAIASASISPILSTVGGKEVYKFSDVPLINFPGVGSILQVKSVSFIYANYRYSIPIYSFSTYQAKIRQYPYQYSYIPTMGAQFGQGTAGTLYLYPIASTVYQMEWDALCLPMDLETDQDAEAIPLPWTDGVAFLATHYAYLSLQNLNAGSYYFKLWEDMQHRFSAAARSGRRTNPYGGW